MQKWKLISCHKHLTKIAKTGNFCFKKYGIISKNVLSCIQVYFKRQFVCYWTLNQHSCKIFPPPYTCEFILTNFKCSFLLCHYWNLFISWCWHNPYTPIDRPEASLGLEHISNHVIVCRLSPAPCTGILNVLSCFLISWPSKILWRAVHSLLSTVLLFKENKKPSKSKHGQLIKKQVIEM